MVRIKGLTIYEIESRYKPNEFVEDERALKIMAVINSTKVTATERRLFCLYLEVGSAKKVEFETGIKAQNINAIVRKIRALCVNLQ